MWKAVPRLVFEFQVKLILLINQMQVVLSTCSCLTSGSLEGEHSSSSYLMFSLSSLVSNQQIVALIVEVAGSSYTEGSS